MDPPRGHAYSVVKDHYSRQPRLALPCGASNRSTVSGQHFAEESLIGLETLSDGVQNVALRGNEGNPFSIFPSDSLVLIGTAVPDWLRCRHRFASRCRSAHTGSTTCEIYDIRSPRLGKGRGGGACGDFGGCSRLAKMEGQALKRQRVRSVPERIEAKPGDLIVFVFVAVTGMQCMFNPSFRFRRSRSSMRLRLVGVPGVEESQMLRHAESRT